MNVYNYARIRITEEELDNQCLNLLCDTVTDRLNLRLGTNTLPTSFERIAAEASVKAFRRMYYEGINTESVADISTNFISDILREYDDEIAAYKAYGNVAENGTGGIVRFL